jgi:hypothetical protein
MTRALLMRAVSSAQPRFGGESGAELDAASVANFLVDNGLRHGGLTLGWGVHFHPRSLSSRPFARRLLSSGVPKMNRIDWEWQAQLETCQRKIVELEEKVASQSQKLQRLLDGNMNAIFAERILAMREESLERVQNWKRLIETRIADAADQSVELPCHNEKPAGQAVDVSHRFER